MSSNKEAEELPKMRIILITWEYPPKIVGGIARHVYDLSNALVKLGIEVHVVTCEHPDAATEEVENGVHLYRVTPEGTGNDFVHWVQLLNNAMYTRAEKLILDLQKLDAKAGRVVPTLIHAHDWLAHFASNGLKKKFGLPLVATIHATEYGRNNGINGPLQGYINSVEWELTYEAWRVIVCTEFMKRECEFALKTPWNKMDVIYNGVEPAKFDISMSDAEKVAFRAKYAAPEEKIIFFVGRMVREKGVQVLIEALPKIRWGYHDAKLLIVGGGYKDHLISLAQYIAMDRHVYFAGFVPDEDLLKIFKIIDIACFPSLYEPFGIVALEAMAAKVPVVVSDAGGLPEVVRNGITGTTTYAGNPNSLADGILSVLHEPAHATAMAEAGYQDVLTVFNWERIAKQTIDVYERVWTEYSDSLPGSSSAGLKSLEKKRTGGTKAEA
jgi:glycosyltransferase involved in cell wall biosynthesis